MSLNELSKKCHEQAKKSKFYKNDEQLGQILVGTGFGDYVLSMRICQLIALVKTELSEAIEADRKDKFCKIASHSAVFYGNIPDELFKHEYINYIKNTFEDEIAGALIRIFDLCGFLNIDIDSHVKAAMRYNSLREEKHGKKY